MSEKVLQVGDAAPDFTLRGSLGSKVTLSEFRGRKNVVLSFHPLAWTSVCAAQMLLLELAHERFEALDTQLLGLSVDSVPSKAAWAEVLGVKSYPLLADFHPQGAVAERYGILHEKGFSQRAVFVVDKEGIVRFARVYPGGELPRPEEILPVLEELEPGR
jgi:peroxiredoxin